MEKNDEKIEIVEQNITNKKGAIGITLGVIAGLLGTAATVAFCKRRKNKNEEESNDLEKKSN